MWAEQEAHAFPFGCVAPDLTAVPGGDRRRCMDRLDEVFNRVTPAGHPPDPAAIRVDVPDDVRLGRFRVELDRLASAGRPLDVHVRGRSVGLGADGPAAERVTALESDALVFCISSSGTFRLTALNVRSTTSTWAFDMLSCTVCLGLSILETSDSDIESRVSVILAMAARVSVGAPTTF